MIRYGQETPPRIPIENIRDFPVSMHCGLTDHLSQIDNFRWLREKLLEQTSLAQYVEYNFGHLSFMLPTDAKIINDVVKVIKALNPAYVPANASIPPMMSRPDAGVETKTDEEKAQTSI